MRRLLFVSLAGASLLSACAAGDDSGAETTASARSSVNPEGVVKAYLKGKGKGKAADQLRTVSQGSANGLTHLRLEQTVDGFRVHGVYAKASVDGQGNLVNMIDGVPGHSNHPSPASAVERDALAAALAHLGYAPGSAGAAVGTVGNLTAFGKGNTFHRDPTVERVAYVDDTAGVLREGFLVETWSVVGNQLNHTLVDGKGKVLETELRTNNDSYLVYKTDPRDPATTVSGPTTGDPWLGAGAQTTHNITGNNVHAYLDSNADNAPDTGTGATAVTNGVFNAALEDAAPTTVTNRAVAVQNLFYLNNFTHDTLYAHGFNEAAGNFQTNNYGRGGAGNDAVNAEAQDGSGTDNANFATPADGSAPRMQMYLWTGRVPSALVTGGATPVGAYQSSFGPALTVTGIGPQTVVVASPADGCTTVSGVSGKIALVDRGTCDFVVKVRNAQSAGAIGVIIAQNTAAAPFSAGGTDRRISIPSVMISQADRAAVVGLSAKLVKNTATARQVDGDLDSGIVYHEYGHGLTWRMVGSMSGPLAGALGEGSSDVVAMLINADPIMGAYAYSDDLGIRRAPYDNYTLTYAAVTGAEVHNDGEIWAAAVWRVYENYQTVGLDNIDLLDDFVKSLNFDPAKPTFEQMRDGLVQQAALSGRECLVWDGMASIGLGVGSKAQLKGTRVTTTPSFTVPATCP